MRDVWLFLRKVADKLNQHTREVQALQTEVALLVELVLRKDAEADELRTWLQELERRQLTPQWNPAVPYVSPGITFGPGVTAHPFPPITGRSIQVSGTLGGTTLDVGE